MKNLNSKGSDLFGNQQKVLLLIGEWADATGQLNEDRPGRRREMNNRHPAPTQGQCPAENGKQDERQMEQEDAVRGKTKIHEDVDIEGSCQTNTRQA